MKTIYLIGMGTGALKHLTLQAVDAIRRIDVFFVLEKDGAGKEELARLRREVLAEIVPGGRHRVVAAPSPPRHIREDDYRQGIDDWRRDRAAIVERLIAEELGEDEVGGFLVWGDPCLYDGMIQTLGELKEAGLDIDVDVFAGISSVQALTAAHRLPLNRVGETITITTGRQLRRMPPQEVRNCVVMLDGQAAFRAHMDAGLEIYWGAYLGTADEITIAGPLDQVADDIARAIEEARARKGWIMDTYILRRR